MDYKERYEQKPAEPSDEELVRHPPIAYTYPSDASRDEQLKMALLALLNSDLIKVAGNKFTKQDLIDWVEKRQEQKPAWSGEDEEMLEYVIGDVNDAKQLFATKEAIDLCDKEIAWLKSLPMRCPKSSDNWKPSEEQMNALNFAITYFMHETSYKNPTELRDLYEQLKKL